MKTSMTLILLALVISGMAACSGGDQGNGDPGETAAADTADKPVKMIPSTSTVAATEKNLEICRSATKKLGGALKSALQEAMGEGGPLGAMNVCHDESEVIAQRICEEEGLAIGRTSRKFRNPSNAPDEWEKAGLETFAARIVAGERPKDLELWATVTDADGGRTFRYLKAIPTAPLCLSCHGGGLTPDLAEKLAELYPEDQARGFSVGDMRGAFTVQLELPRLGG